MWSKTIMFPLQLALGLFFLGSAGVTGTQCDESTSDVHMTMTNFIRLLKKAESQPDLKNKPAEDLAYMLTKYFANTKNFRYFFGKIFTSWGPDHVPLGEEDREIIKAMIKHNTNDEDLTETGIIITSSGDTIALGHVITGILAGLERDRNMVALQMYFSTVHKFSYNLDNLHAVTISGDLGQTTCRFYSTCGSTKVSTLIGPGGRWNGKCEGNYTMSGPTSEATEPEVLGDIDGFILGTVQYLWKTWKLSKIFETYYGSGINSQIKGANRMENFNLLVTELELIEQSVSFYEAYNPDSARLHKHRVPKTIEEFYKQPYFSVCPGKSRFKYTINSFIQLVKEYENGKTLTRTLGDPLGFSKYFRSSRFKEFLDLHFDTEPTDTFDTYVMYNMVHHNINYNYRRQVGVLQDNEKVTLVIGHVLAGILAGTNGDESDVIGVTIGGDLYEFANFQDKATFGRHGTWIESCPPYYKLYSKSKIDTFLPRLYGSLDGAILGLKIKDILAKNPHIKLSTILEHYYSSVLDVDGKTSSKKRIQIFKTLASKDHLKALLKSTCYKLKQNSHVPSYGHVSYYPVYLDQIDCSKFPGPWLELFFKDIIKPETDSSQRYNSKTLPSFRTLKDAYPGDKAYGGDYDTQDLLKALGLESAEDTTAVQISYMLNNLDGHWLPLDTPGCILSGGKCYLDKNADLEKVLISKYGQPKTSIGVKPGIVFFKRGTGAYLGLWDGSDTFRGPSASFDGQSVAIWEAYAVSSSSSVVGDCEELARKGDCKFYLECIEKPLGCDPSAYPRAYGYKYCMRFGEFYDSFSPEGKKWIDEVRVCLMKALLNPRKRPGMTCSQIENIAFNSHDSCYVESGNSICYDVYDVDTALSLFSDVYVYRDFLSLKALKEVGETFVRCVLTYGIDGSEKIVSWMTRLVDTIDEVLDADHNSDHYSEIESAASDGLCTFYGYFEEKFDCSSKGDSIVGDALVFLCQKGYQQATLMTSEGKAWFKNYQKCMMEALLTMYEETEISCQLLPLNVIKLRRDCMVSTNLCLVLEDNIFALERWTDTESYPYILPHNYMKRPMGDKSVLIKPYYYTEAMATKRMFDDVMYYCKRNGVISEARFDSYARARGLNDP